MRAGVDSLSVVHCFVGNPHLRSALGRWCGAPKQSSANERFIGLVAAVRRGSAP